MKKLKTFICFLVMMISVCCMTVPAAAATKSKTYTLSSTWSQPKNKVRFAREVEYRIIIKTNSKLKPWQKTTVTIQNLGGDGAGSTKLGTKSSVFNRGFYKGYKKTYSALGKNKYLYLFVSVPYSSTKIKVTANNNATIAAQRWKVR